MPYISQARRRYYNTIVEAMGIRVRLDGGLNYILFAFCKRYIKPSYINYRNFCGELRQCATEIERRLLAPYEDTKIEEHGDVE